MFKRILLLTCFSISALMSYGQDVTACPPNLGFDDGTLRNWQAYTGKINQDGTYTPFEPGEVPGRHTVIRRNTETDPWGTFPLNSPNGSEYIIRLGNKNLNSEADRISYSFDVPSDVESYAIVFNYAVVFQEIDPPHPPWQQPKFTVVVIDENTDTRDECASFEYTSKSGLPGFFQADNGAYYKPWSPVMVNLTKYIGHSVRLEFTTNDCAEIGHFGYAYIDVNENCAAPIFGNVTCPENNSITLRTLPGFEKYRWFDRDTKVTYGTTENLYMSPTLPIGTRIAVELVPYLFAGGCTDTLYAVIKNMGDIQIRSPLVNCLSIDLTAPSIVGGNQSGITYSYWKDPQARVPLANPRNIRISGTYYIMGRLLPSGCFSIMPVVVNITPLAPVAVNPPDPVNYPGTIDLTKTFTPLPGIQYSYWIDRAAQNKEVIAPEKISVGGIFYIKAIDQKGCMSVTAVRADIIVPDIIIPNTFTPNGDGINDVLTILIDSRIRIKNFQVFNRWGQMVYETSDINKFWNGDRKGSVPLPGVYFWVLMGDENSRKYKRSGSVTVIR